MANISPEYLDNLSRDLTDVYADTETDLMLLLSEELAQNGDLLEEDPTEWQRQQTNRLNLVTAAAFLIISRNTKNRDAMINSMTDKAVDTSRASIEGDLIKGAKAGILKTPLPYTQSPTINALIELSKSNTYSTFSGANNTMLFRTGQDYVNLVNKTTAEMLSGKFTLTTAAKEISANDVFSKVVKDFNNNGISAFVDTSC